MLSEVNLSQGIVMFSQFRCPRLTIAKWLLVGAVALIGNEFAEPVLGQQNQIGQPGSGVAIQLPSVTNFGISTAVRIPDGGAVRLGGVTRGASGYSSNGVPMVSNIPGINSLFRSQAFGSTYSSAQSSVRVHLIISKEIEEDVLAEAERRIIARKTIDPNGSAEVQRRAALLSRSIGRR